MGNAAFIANKYYSDPGMDYVYSRLKEELSYKGVNLCYERNVFAAYPMVAPKYDFAVFWDKDVALAYRLESAGIRLFNSARTVEICDDKQKTFAVLSGVIPLPQTVCAPLVYDVSSGNDDSFIKLVEATLGYPVVVKENVGSQGRQVYLAANKSELVKINNRLMHVPHHYQKFIKGDIEGSDTRVYIIGKRAVGAITRVNPSDFRSNTALGGKAELTNLTPELISIAQKAAEALELDYGSVDFIKSESGYVFIEANGSPYMLSAEKLGINLSKAYAEYLAEAVYER